MPPLADLLRPTDLDQFIGQTELVGENGIIRRLLEKNELPSMIFWGPPASGKTSLASVIANQIDSDFIKLSAVMDGKDDLKKTLKIAEKNKAYNRKTILFIDEIHRWNKAQQDALLPFVENGTIILIGATTENPSFTIISALLSRCRVFVFQPHSREEISLGLQRGLKYLRKQNPQADVKIDKETIDYMAALADGDMRFALNSLEIATQLQTKVDRQIVEKAAQKSLNYDKNGDWHYDLISAVHKSLRSGNATAGVYWIMRMLGGGEDPLYVARRLLRFASEDIGNANPNALLLANQVFSAVERLGMPECETALVQLAEYLASSPKNNSAYKAANQAKADIQKFGNLAVPLHFRNTSTKLMKELGYGQNYQYDHDLPSGKSSQECLPEELKGRNYFET